MREFAKVSPQFWIGEKGRAIKQLGLETQHLAFYLLTSPHANMIGIYYLPITTIAHETSLSYDQTLKALHNLTEADYCSYDEITEYVWVHDMAHEQIGAQLKPNDKRVKGVNTAYHLLPNLPFLPAFFKKYQQVFYLNNNDENEKIEEAPSKALRSKEKDKDNNKEKDNEKETKISLSGKPDVVSLFDISTLQSQALEILQFLNEKTGRVYRPVDTNLKLIMARLKSGVTVMDCRQVIAKKTREWRGNPKMSEFLRPATLFNATKFEQYLGELVLPAEGVAHDVH